MTDCLFCKIIKKEISSFIVFEDKEVVAFLDIHPIREGHILVVPKKHVEDFYDLTDKDLSHIFLITKKLSKKISKIFKPKKVGIVIAGLDVPHTHVHIIPMHEYHDITSKSTIEGKRLNPSEKELIATASKIK